MKEADILKALDRAEALLKDADGKMFMVSADTATVDGLDAIRADLGDAQHFVNNARQILLSLRLLMEMDRTESPNNLEKRVEALVRYTSAIFDGNGGRRVETNDNAGMAEDPSGGYVDIFDVRALSATREEGPGLRETLSAALDWIKDSHDGCDEQCDAKNVVIPQLERHIAALAARTVEGEKK